MPEQRAEQPIIPEQSSSVTPETGRGSERFSKGWATLGFMTIWMMAVGASIIDGLALASYGVGLSFHEVWGTPISELKQYESHLATGMGLGVCIGILHGMFGSIALVENLRLRR